MYLFLLAASTDYRVSGWHSDSFTTPGLSLDSLVTHCTAIRLFFCYRPRICDVCVGSSVVLGARLELTPTPTFVIVNIVLHWKNSGL